MANERPLCTTAGCSNVVRGNGKRKDGSLKWTKLCGKCHNKKNGSYTYAVVKHRTKKHRIKKRDSFQSFKEFDIKFRGGCQNILCSTEGVLPPVCYDYHHVDSDDKEFDINRKKFTCLEKIKSEILKCVILCACCHRLVHHLPSSVVLRDVKLDNLFIDFEGS